MLLRKHTCAHLVLLAVRDTASGAYWSRGALEAFAALHHVPLAPLHSEAEGAAAATTVTANLTKVHSLGALRTNVAGWSSGREGVVLALGRGARFGCYKIKSEWYVGFWVADVGGTCLHRALFWTPRMGTEIISANRELGISRRSATCSNPRRIGTLGTSH